MPPTKLMIIRHAEKPSKDGDILGIDAAGREDPQSLSPRGWQRAGALVRFFAPRQDRFTDPALARPDFIVAAGVGPDSPSERSSQTVAPLARFLDVAADTRFPPDRERDTAEAILALHGVVLIAWEHRRIGDLVLALTKGQVVPPYWDSDRFDVVLVLDPGDEGWALTQVLQRLLPDDSKRPLTAHSG